MIRASYLMLLTIITASILAWPIGAKAHEVPDQVTVLTFLKPEGKTLTLLVRAPMKSLRDVDVPLKANGFLDLSRVDSPLEHAAQLWISDFVELYENDVRLAKPRLLGARVSLPSDRSFAGIRSGACPYRKRAAASGYGDLLGARAARCRLRVSDRIGWIEFRDPAGADAPWASGQCLDAVPASGRGRAGVRRPCRCRHGPPRSELAAGLRSVREDRGSCTSSTGSTICSSCSRLVIPFRRLRPLIGIVTAFTVAHSITLIASAYGLAPDALWFPPLIETLIALSILYMALENIVGASFERRWVVTFAFGLVHGFGFSFLLSERLQFAGSHLVTSLLAFNLGVELGQIVVLMVAVPALGLLFRYVVEKRIGTIILSALVAHTAWHWMVDRGWQLSQYPWPKLDAVALSTVLWWAMAAVALAGLLWLLSGLIGRWEQAGMGGSEPAPDHAPLFSNRAAKR